ncbi:helix-turn-helix domain-containing protein [Streptomyces sp. H34-S4]|uniref:helix-turn-helix domain-containing protein n=1 Tax=Streptomyces sp. H34-S4 TaxID=2996463 RepID=UPI003B632A86
MTQSVTEPGLPTPKERRRLREAADLTHEEVAAAVGVTSNTVRSWETGRTHPRGRKLEAYCKLLTRLSAAQAPDSAPADHPGPPDGPATTDSLGRTDGSTPGPDGAARAGGGSGATGAGDGGTARAGGAGAIGRAEQGGGRSEQDDTAVTGPGTDRVAAAGHRAGRTDGGTAGTAAVDTPTRPAWANGAATPEIGPAASTGAAGADADAASAASPPPGGATDRAEAATDPVPADADAPSAAEAPEERFGLRLIRGLTRPVGTRTRPKAAVKRAAKPPVGVPRHETKATAKAGATAYGGNGGGSLAALRSGGPLPPSTTTSTAPDTGSDSGQNTGPDTGKATTPDTKPGSGKATTPDTDPSTGKATALGTTSGTGSGTTSSTASSTGKSAGSDPGADPGPAAAGRDRAPGVGEGPEATEPPAETASATSAFDSLYDRTAPALTRQAYLLTGRRALSHEAVERAFQQAWARWPEVATDPDPVGWIRAAAYEYALSPWHQLRRAHKHPDKPPADPADRVLMDAMLGLPAAHRRTVLLYDGVGLDLPDTAAETEASTPTAGRRLVNAHADLADQLPELADVAPEKQSAVLRERLGTLKPAGPLEPRAAALVRVAGEHRARLWTRAVVGVSVVIVAATAYTAVTAPTEYEPPRAPGANVSGVPPHSGPQRLTDEGRQLHDKLLSDPAAGPSRIAPSLD